MLTHKHSSNKVIKQRTVMKDVRICREQKGQGTMGQTRSSVHRWEMVGDDRSLINSKGSIVARVTQAAQAVGGRRKIGIRTCSLPPATRGVAAQELLMKTDGTTTKIPVSNGVATRVPNGGGRQREAITARQKRLTETTPPVAA
ncbi:unnamed protein product [Soboliphyme baturini]|uniref:DUF834 domain-containing protein n=1 Tax=Soboliphyme baturini TaxID=241478 RepID=A0A183IRK7_9BILA|nr:unnamed protein product [Soboliphyme baturini]